MSGTLKGQGFTPRVKIGDKVETGAALIELDLDYVATNAKSLPPRFFPVNHK